MKFKVKGHIIIPYEYELEAEGSISAYRKAKEITLEVDLRHTKITADHSSQLKNFNCTESKTEVHNITPIPDGETT